MGQTVIYVIIAICLILAIALTAILVYLWLKEKKATQASDPQSSPTSKTTTTKLQGIESMSKFLDFDEVVAWL